MLLKKHRTLSFKQIPISGWFCIYFIWKFVCVILKIIHNSLFFIATIFYVSNNMSFHFGDLLWWQGIWSIIIISLCHRGAKLFGYDERSLLGSVVWACRDSKSYKKSPHGGRYNFSVSSVLFNKWAICTSKCWDNYFFLVPSR